jgi:thiol-disulfide isomerase/thioredoxin
MKPRSRFLIFAVLLLLSSTQLFAQFAKRPWTANVRTPSIEYTDLSGQLWNWQKFKGKVLVINFWATWCAPCTEELPSLQRLQDLHQNNHLTVLTINHKEAPSKIRQFNAASGFTLPVVADREGDIAKSWGVKIFPTSVILSTEGKPLWIIEGSVDWTSKEILDLL